MMRSSTAQRAWGLDGARHHAGLRLASSAHQGIHRGGLVCAALSAPSTGFRQRACMASRRCRKHVPVRPSRQLTVTAKAMVNVDFASPSLVLGAVLIGCGVLLLQMRNMQTRVSRDADIVVAAMISIVGSTLIFQGWRLDPLLLLCQALTTSVAVWYGIETFRLRSKEEELEQTQAQLPPPQQSSTPPNTWAAPPASQQPPAFPPQQQPQQPGMLPDWMNVFGTQQQASGQQPPIMQQTLYPQQPQPTGYLPPADTQQPYPWSMDPYSMQPPQEAQPQGMDVTQGAWQYGSPAEQYPTQTWAPQGQYIQPQAPQEYIGYGVPDQQGTAAGGFSYQGPAADGNGEYSMPQMQPYAQQQQQQPPQQYPGYVSQASQPAEQGAAGQGTAYAGAPAQAAATPPKPAGPGVAVRRVVEQIDDWE